MPTPIVISTESFLNDITDLDGTIHLSALEKMAGGGTHDIYRSDKCPGLLLKVMYRTVGKTDIELSQHLEKLNGQYSELYEAFGESRCIIEERSIQPIQFGIDESPQQAIVSVVPFESCFESDEKFGFNVEPEELNETIIKSKRYLYSTANKSLLGSDGKATPYVIRNYPLLNKNFDKIFKLLDTDPSLLTPMREFLTKYKSFYKESGILLDTIGFDNVLFYKNEEGWQFKLGSVIKHDTGALTKEMLEKIVEDPTIVNDANELYFTSIYLMPACIRALNACAEKVGLEKIIDDISVSDETIDALAQSHLQREVEQRALDSARQGNFSTALALYRQYQPHEDVDSTYIRGNMGTLYWAFIKTGGKETSRSEVEAYLSLLRDERNKIPEPYQKQVDEAIEGLTQQLLLLTVSISHTEDHQEIAEELSQRYRHVLDDLKRSKKGPPVGTEDEKVADYNSPSPFQTTLKPKFPNK